jgi:putative hemolysin
MQPLSPFPWLSVAVIFALIVLNGLFAMSELAIVSSRKARLQAMAKVGRIGATTALKLRDDPGRLLSTVQIGITLISILTGAFSGAALEVPVGQRLALIGVPAKYGFAATIVVTTYVSLIVGELVPKQFALRSPEPIAALAAVPMDWFARVTAPIGWLLDQSSALIFRLLRLQRETEQHVTAEELQLIVAEASRSGVIEESERAIISGVVRLADRPVREVMTPRTAIDWIDIDADAETVRRRLIETPHTRLPVAEGSVDQIVGVLQSRDVAAALLEHRPLDLRTLMRPLLVVPDQVDAMDALHTLRRADVPMVLVQDEYGHLEGLLTPADLFAALAGRFAFDEDEGTDPDCVEREDGSLLISGSLPADALAERLDLQLSEDRDYATAAGFALSVLRRLPTVGEHFEEQGWRFEIVDMDGRKIDKLLVSAVRR